MSDRHDIDVDFAKTAHEALVIFSSQLQTEWGRERTPHGFDKAREDARSAIETSTSRIFYEVGFQCWLAYFLTNIGKGKHYQGKSARDSTIAAFDQLSAQQRRDTALELSTIVPHPTVAEGIKELLSRPGPRAGMKRRRTATDIEPPIQATVSSASETQDLLLAGATQQTPDLSDSTSDPNITDKHSSDHSPSRVGLENTTAIFRNPGGAEHDYISHPPNSCLGRVFMPYMCTAIVKNGDRAAISMVFPYADVACLTSLSILPNKVQHIAMELFNVHVEEESGSRYVVTETGATIHPYPELRLQGGRLAGVCKLLGQQWTTAVTSCPVYSVELEAGLPTTRSVSMIINKDPAVPAMLNLDVGLSEGFEFKDLMFGKDAKGFNPPSLVQSVR